MRNYYEKFKTLFVVFGIVGVGILILWVIIVFRNMIFDSLLK